MKRGLALLLSVSLMLAAAPSISAQAANQGAAASGERIESVTEEKSVPAAGSERKEKGGGTGASASSSPEKADSSGEAEQPGGETTDPSGETEQSGEKNTEPASVFSARSIPWRWRRKWRRAKSCGRLPT